MTMIEREIVMLSDGCRLQLHDFGGDFPHTLESLYAENFKGTVFLSDQELFQLMLAACKHFDCAAVPKVPK